MKIIKYIIIFIVIVISGIVVWMATFTQPNTQPDVEFLPNNSVAKTVLAPDIPLSLEIPSINLKTSIGQAGLTESGKLEIPKIPDSTVWFNGGPRPGETGSAVISGHYGTWADGSPSVFDNLHKMKVGDKVYVKDINGQVFTFVVTQTKVYDANAIVPEIFNKTDDAYLNLITCSGQWLPNERTFDKRLVVFTKQL